MTQYAKQHACTHLHTEPLLHTPPSSTKPKQHSRPHLCPLCEVSRSEGPGRLCTGGVRFSQRGVWVRPADDEGWLCNRARARGIVGRGVRIRGSLGISGTCDAGVCGFMAGDVVLCGKARRGSDGAVRCWRERA
jgi:hypothetical protein